MSDQDEEYNDAKPTSGDQGEPATPSSPPPATGEVGSPPKRHYEGAALVTKDRLPLHTQGRFVVDKLNERVKLSCVNWYGAESTTFVPGGFETADYRSIIRRVYDLGFNCVRLPYSVEGVLTNPLVKEEFLAANKDLIGLHFLDIFDLIIDAFAQHNILVFPDNHVSPAGWCCHWSQPQGLWYVPEYPEEAWIGSLVNLTRRYTHNPHVAGMDIRNELHDYDGTILTWGDGNPKTDWAAAATRAGKAIHAENPAMLIIVMSLCSGIDLRGLRHHQVQLDVPNQVVYQVHNYIEYQFWDLAASDTIDHFWAILERACCVIATLLALGVVRVALPWWRSGRPRPARSVLVMSLGAWVAFYGFLLSPIFYKVYSAACLYCPGGSAIDLLPMFYHSMGIAACGLLLAVGGYVLGRQDGFVSVRAISFDTGTEADALVGSVDSSILPGPHQQKEEELPVECPSYVQKALGLERPEPELMGQWHRGHTCRLQCGVACLGLIYLLWLLRNLAITLSSYEFLEWWLDEHWGFTTEEGRDFTAPVLVGEWGYLNHGPYWLGFVRYMSRRDLDFAYWPLNGRKYTTGHVVPTTGAWLPLDNPEWENETYGLLSPDYHTLNEAWRIRDLQALMESPARWNPTDMGCKTRDHSYYDCSTGIYWLENFTG